jgi:hypothetical protein
VSSGGAYNCVHNGVTPRKGRNGWSTKANENAPYRHNVRFTTLTCVDALGFRRSLPIVG